MFWNISLSKHVVFGIRCLSKKIKTYFYAFIFLVFFIFLNHLGKLHTFTVLFFTIFTVFCTGSGTGSGTGSETGSGSDSDSFDSDPY